MINTLVNNFIPMVGFNNPKGFPIIGISSGFLFYKNNNVFIFGALHSIIGNVNKFSEMYKKLEHIAIELFFVPNKGALLVPYSIKHLNFSSTHYFNSSNKEFFNDFFCVQVPKQYLYKLRSTKVFNHITKVEEIQHKYIFDKIASINIGDKFAFAGNTNPRFKKIDKYPYSIKLTDIMYDEDLQFLRSDDKDHTLIFRLSTKCKDINQYKGCSGSPIVNTNNELVSIAIRVNCIDNELIGVNLKYFEQSGLLDLLMYP